MTTTTMSDHDVSFAPMPGSPPDLTGSKSSKSSSYHSSYQSDDHGIADAGNFEDIGLDDDARAEAEVGSFAVKPSFRPYHATSMTDLRIHGNSRRAPIPAALPNRATRELTANNLRSSPGARGAPMRSVTSVDALGLMPQHSGPRMTRGFRSPSSPSFPILERQRSRSPSLQAHPAHLSAGGLRSRRGSWQSGKERKTAEDLEKECDDDDGDDLPDDVYLENIPISPRPPQERAASRPASAATSPERPPKEKVRSVGNGTSPRPAEQGELRSPKPGMHRGASMGQFPINQDLRAKGRARSWTAALSALSEEAQALTQALEDHADDEDKKADEPRRQRSTSSAVRAASEKPRVKSATAELPPLRRTDIMIDPLPCSKEKEAVLSRTRPSWLPPKDPAEERRHLKEYQKMMAQSLQAERKKEAEAKAKSTCRDDTAGTLLRIWEEHVLPNWDKATSQKRTRELWWRGIAPRSRGAVWSKAIGNQLGLTDASYTAALRRAQALEKTIKAGSQLSAEEIKKKGWLDKIENDVKNSYPDLKIFQPEGPLHTALLDVLKAYAMYRSDVGYVHGTSTIAAILLLNLPTSSSAFCALSNLLNRPLPLSFHTSDTGAITRSYNLVLHAIEQKSPRLHGVLTSAQTGPPPHTYLREMFASLFTTSLNLDNTTRLWDVMVFEGDAVLVRAGVAYLLTIENKLFGAGNPAEVCETIREGLGEMSENDWMKALRGAGKS